MNAEHGRTAPRWSLLLGPLCGLVYWIGESLLHVVFFDGRTFREELWPVSDPNELWMRLFILFLFFVLAFAFDHMYSRVRAAQKECEGVVVDLEQALQEIRTIKGLIPICSVCKKIRDDAGSWQKLETYLRKHSDAEFSHGYCPDCYQEVMKELDAQFRLPENQQVEGLMRWCILNRMTSIDDAGPGSGLHCATERGERDPTSQRRNTTVIYQQ